MNIVLLGAPGSGKGTQAARLVKANGFTHINPGSLFRDELAAGTELGWKVSGALQRGELVSDELATEAVFNKVGTQHDGFLFDGYPRTIIQAGELETSHAGSDLVIYLAAPLDVLKERLLARQRADDLSEVIEERFRWFEEFTLPVVDLYCYGGNRFVQIDATLPVAEVTEKIQAAIAAIVK